MGALKIFHIILLIQCYHGYSNGQKDSKFFRNDYRYVEDYRSFYKVNTIQRTWEEANSICELEGASLFYPKDRSEAQSITGYFAETLLFNMIFIGASAGADGKFVTVDGSPLSNAYSNFKADSVKNGDCAVMTSDTKMIKDNCNHRYPFICKKHIDTLDWDNKCDLPYKGYVLNETLGKCYKFHLTPKDWSAAYATCRAELSYLVVIQSQAEADHLVRITEEAPKDQFKGSYLSGVIHAGFHNRYGEGWRTIHDVVLAESGFNGWALGEPNGGESELCGSMYYTGQLNDLGCSHKCFFVCEHDVDELSNSIDIRMAQF